MCLIDMCDMTHSHSKKKKRLDKALELRQHIATAVMSDPLEFNEGVRFVCVCVYVCVNVCGYVCVGMCVCVFRYVCVYVYVATYCHGCHARPPPFQRGSTLSWCVYVCTCVFVYMCV